MGTILIDAFLESSAIKPTQLFIHNRTMDKAFTIKKRHPSINLREEPVSIVKQCSIVFICVKPLQFHTLLAQLKDHLNKNMILISITSPISIEQLESIVPCKIARAIPSILNRAQAGPSLLSFGSRCTDSDKRIIRRLMDHISTPLIIKENITRVSSDIVSCGPAFFSYIIQRFVDAAVRQTEISEEEATILATDMIIGMGKLLEKGVFTLPTLQERVCVPGGITGEGIKVLEAEIGDMFDQLFEQTHAKYREDKEKIKKQFTGKQDIRKY
jgi:competence protein ComER